jgi:hypothetical protein
VIRNEYREVTLVADSCHKNYWKGIEKALRKVDIRKIFFGRI